MEQKTNLPLGEDKEYNLKCKVKIVRQSYKEISDGRNHEATSVLLLPDLDATETSRFFITYLPDISTVCLDCGSDNVRIYHKECAECGSTNVHTEYTEVPSWIGNPVHSACRLAVLRKNNYCSQHHLFVMSTGVEEDLKEMDGKTVMVAILPTDQDALCDTAKSVSRTVKQSSITQ